MITFRPAISADWRGLDALDEELWTAGYGIYRSYQGEIIAFCENLGCARGVADYWREVAKEFLASGRLAADRVDRGADRSSRNVFRSSLLDELEARTIECGVADKMSFPPVHPCIRSAYSDLNQGGSLAGMLTQATVRRRDLEIEAFNIDTRELITVASVHRNFFDVGKVMGFDKVTPKHGAFAGPVASFRSTSGKIIYGYVTVVHVPRLPLAGAFSVVWQIGLGEPDLHKDLSLGDLSLVMPGINYYSRNILHNGHVVLGASALIMAARALIEAINK